MFLGKSSTFIDGLSSESCLLRRGPLYVDAATYVTLRVFTSSTVWFKSFTALNGSLCVWAGTRNDLFIGTELMGVSVEARPTCKGNSTLYCIARVV